MDSCEDSELGACDKPEPSEKIMRLRMSEEFDGSPEIVPGSPKASPKVFISYVQTPQTSDKYLVNHNSHDKGVITNEVHEDFQVEQFKDISPISYSSSVENTYIHKDQVPKFHLGLRSKFPYPIKRREQCIQYIRCTVIKTVCTIDTPQGTQVEREFFDLIKPLNVVAHSGSLGDISSSLSKSSGDSWSYDFSNKCETLSTASVKPKEVSHEIDFTNYPIISKSYAVGDLVLAKWSDKNFYPATVLQISSGQSIKIRVVFVDGNTKLVPASDLMKLNLIPPGISAFVKLQQEYHSGIITSVIKTQDKVTYVMHVDGISTPVEVEMSDLMFTSDQVQIIQEGPLYLSSSDVLHGTIQVSSPAVDSPVQKNIQRDCPNTSNKTNVSPVVPSSSKIGLSTRKRKYVYSSSLGSDSSNTEIRVPRKRGRPKKSSYSAAKPGKYLPVAGKKGNWPVRDATVRATGTLFKNFGFVFTKVENFTEDMQKEAEMSKYFQRLQSSYPSSSDSEDLVQDWCSMLPSPSGYDKSRVINAVISEGGTVFDSIQELKLFHGKKFLISNCICRSEKFIRAVAASIPCLYFKWVEESIRKNCSMNPNMFVLPYGISIESRELVNERRSSEPLKGQNILINLSDFSLYRDISLDAGATIIRDALQANYILTDSSCPLDLVSMASTHNIPLVSVVWLVDCITRGELVNEHFHMRYSYNVGSPHDI